MGDLRVKDLMAIAHASLQKLEAERGPEFAIAAARIAYAGSFVSALTRFLSQTTPESARAESLLQSMAVVAGMHADCEAKLLGVDGEALCAAGLALADDMDLGGAPSAGGVH
jgi:hypothetical protein